VSGPDPCGPMWKSGPVDEATWAALAATLTVLGLVWTWISYRRRGVTGGMRALGFTMLPVAAWLTGTLEMFTEMAGSATDWATGLVFNPITWTGIGLGGFGIVLIVISGYLRDRQLARGQEAKALGTATKPGKRRLPEAASSRDPGGSMVGDDGADDLADIEAILKRRGIK
jgi:hypothetical protein